MKKRIVIFIAACIILALSANARGGIHPWGEYGQNPQNTGVSQYVGPANIDRTWSFPLDYNNRDSFVSPVLDSSGSIYLLDSGNTYVNGQWVKRASLKAINRDGVLKWKKEMDVMCADEHGTSSLALGTNGLLYLSCSSRSWSQWPPIILTKLFGLDAASGAQMWELVFDRHRMESIGNLSIDSKNRLYFVSTYYGDNERYWLGYHTITTVSSSGMILWSSTLGEGQSYDIAGPVISNDEKTIYVYRSTDWWAPAFVNALNTDTGKLEWESPLEWGGTGWQTFSSVTVDKKGTIWLSTYSKIDPDECYGRGEYLLGLNSNGQVIKKWQIDGDISCGSHVRVGPSGTIYVTYDDTYYQWVWDGTQWVNNNKKGGLAAYDPNTGLKWRFELPDSVEANASPAIDASENIYFAASFGERLYSINKDGQVNWVFDIAPGVEPTRYMRWCGVGESGYYEACPNQFIYGVAPVIGLGGSIYAMGLKNLYAIEGVSFKTVTTTIQELISDGSLTTGTGTALINQLSAASAATTPQAKETILNAVIYRINAMEKVGKIDSSTASELRDAIDRL